MGSFHHSCENVHIEVSEGYTYLMCEAKAVDGSKNRIKIRLDDHIGNTDGWFIWGGKGFTQTASNIKLEMTNQGPKLCADLKTHDGGSRGYQGMLLGDKIENNNGHLHFTGP